MSNPLPLSGIKVVDLSIALTGPYAVVLLLVSTASLCFVRAVELNTPAAWLLYVFVATLAVYAHFLASLVVLAHLTSLLVQRVSAVPWRSVARAAALIIVLVVPLAVSVRRHGVGDEGDMALDAFASRVRDESYTRAR